LTPPRRNAIPTVLDPPRSLVEAQAEPTEAATYVAEEMVPARLLDGGEIVILAIKPSLWFILFSSFKWLLAMGLVIALSPALANTLQAMTQTTIVQAALALIGLRVGLAVLQWACRLYVLTNRRIMRIRGVLNIDIVEMQLTKIQNTYLSFDLHERLFRLGSIAFASAGTADIEAAWINVSRPLEIHEQIRKAIHKANHNGDL